MATVSIHAPTVRYVHDCRCPHCKAGRAAYSLGYYHRNRDRINAERKQARIESPAKQAALRAYRLRYVYGIEAADYDRLFERQRGRCAVCRRESEQHLHIDHDYTTGAIRGLLCGPCNRALGGLKEDPDRIDRLAAYVRGTLAEE